jgi:biotin carboxyl carrier protein
MKKLLVTVNGVRFDVEVEIIEDDEFNQMDPSYLQSIARQSRPATPTTLQQPVRTPSSKSKVPQQDASGKSFYAPINGVIIEIPISVGQKINAGEVLFVVEAMKMKTNISANGAGVIKQIHCKVQDTIEAGQELVTFE